MIIYVTLLLILWHVEELHLKMRPSFDKVSSRQDLMLTSEALEQKKLDTYDASFASLWFLSWRYLDPDSILWPKNQL
jgi:hypothetical protein